MNDRSIPTAERLGHSGGRSTSSADDPAFAEFGSSEEFSSSQIEAITDPVARRTFLKLMGASLALAGFNACTRQPAEKIVPYVRQPEEIIPAVRSSLPRR